MQAIVLVSGGLDSCVCLAMAQDHGYDLATMHFNYGQRTERRELEAFHALSRHYGVPESRAMIVSIAHLAAIGGSSLTDKTIPVSPADLESDAIPTSYVPFRNAHFLSAAVSWAEVLPAERIVIGAVFEDSSGYPDCRPEYYAAFNSLIKAGTRDGLIRVETPLIMLSKADIVREGIRLAAPLDKTWSCYQADGAACGECDSCALRLRGFAQAGVPDPLPYTRHAV